MLKERRENRCSIGRDAKLLPKVQAGLSSKQLSGVSVFKGKGDLIQKCTEQDYFSKPYSVYGYGGNVKNMSSKDKSFVLSQEEILLGDKKTICKDIYSNHAKFFSRYIRKYHQIKFIAPGEQEKEILTKRTSLLRDILHDINVMEDSHISKMIANNRSSLLDRMIAALTEPERLAELAPADPLAVARLKGMKVKQKLLYSDGQPLQSEEVAQLLGISQQAVEQERSKGKLLAVSLGSLGYFYPWWQFKDGSVLTGIDRVLDALSKFDAWTQLMFMKTGDLRLNNRTPLECLIAGDIDAVVSAAACYGEPNPA
jgi:hypothetical protein